MESLENALREVKDLERDLSAEVIIKEAVLGEEVEKGGSIGEEGYYNYLARWREREVIEPAMMGPDTIKRENARQNLTRISSSHELPIARYAAAKALGFKAESRFGYYPLRIWAHEHPVAATVTGLITVGATSGLVYALVEYFSK
jgi:hypothetical protein